MASLTSASALSSLGFKAANGWTVPSGSSEPQLVMPENTIEYSSKSFNFIAHAPDEVIDALSLVSSNQTYDEIATVETHSATGETTLAMMGINKTQNILISDGTTIAVNSTSTINDIVSELQSKGITANFDAATSTLTIGDNDDALSVIAMYADLRSALKINIGNGSTYTIENITLSEVTVPQISTSDSIVYNSLFQATTSVQTKLTSSSALTYIDPAATITAPESFTLATFGLDGDYVVYGVTINSANTISEALVKLEDGGVDASYEDGIFSIGGFLIDESKRVANVTAFTSGTTYYISTTEDLIQLQTLVNAGKNGSGCYFELANNIDMSGVTNFTGIGKSSSYSFRGTFNGNGFKIENLNISSSTTYKGLFGYTNGATIKNLGLENCNVSGSQYVGALVGYATSGTISDCYATGTVTASGSDSGGLIGYNRATVTRCYADVNITGASYTGGLIGRNYSGTVSYCYAAGSVTNTSTTGYVGGFVGYFYGGTLNKNYSLGTVTSSQTSTNVGAFVGNSKSKGSDNACNQDKA